MKLSYYDEITPAAYEPRYFTQAEQNAWEYLYAPNKVKVKKCCGYSYRYIINSETMLSSTVALVYIRHLQIHCCSISMCCIVLSSGGSVSDTASYFAVEVYWS